MNGGSLHADWLVGARVASGRARGAAEVVPEPRVRRAKHGCRVVHESAVYDRPDPPFGGSLLDQMVVQSRLLRSGLRGRRGTVAQWVDSVAGSPHRIPRPSERL